MELRVFPIIHKLSLSQRIAHPSCGNYEKVDIMKRRITILLLALTIMIGFASSQQYISIILRNCQVNVKDDGRRKYVEIKWQTMVERGFSYYTLQRSLPDSTSMIDSSSWQEIARIDTVSTTDTIKSYGFIDYPNTGASYIYRLKMITSDNNAKCYISLGEVPASLLTGVNTWIDQDIPREYGCISNYPNPFNPTTTIVLKLQTAEKGSLDIFDLRGRKLESLANGSLPSGIRQYQWDASKYPSGTYFCVLRTQNRTATAKLVLQK
jgi:hypothetical protein